MKKTRTQFDRWNSAPRRTQDSGFSLVEVLVSLAIVSVGLTGLSASLVEMGKAKEKARIVAAALALQADFLDELAREDNFRDAGGIALDPNSVNITIQPGGTPVTMGHNALTYFRDDLTTCPGFSDDCVLSITYDFLQDSPPPPPPAKPIWRAAYRIEISPSAGVAMGPLGTMSTGAFAADDFHFPLPDLLVKDANVAGCSTATDIAIMGFDRDTGAVTCLHRPTVAATCPAGFFGKSFVVNVLGQLVLDCQDGGGVAARVFTCPPNYKLQRIPDPRVFDPTYAGTNPICVWEAQATENNVGAGGGPSVSFTGRVCPRPLSGPAYSFTQTCVLDTGGLQVPQTCYTIAGCATVFINIPPTVPPTSTTVVGASDEVTCTAVTGVTAHDPFVCFDASTDGTWAGTVTFPPRTCTLTRPETVAL